MATFVRIGGVWTPLSSGSAVKNGGAWGTINSIWVRDGGTWKQAHSGSHPADSYVDLGSNKSFSASGSFFVVRAGFQILNNGYYYSYEYYSGFVENDFQYQWFNNAAYIAAGGSTVPTYEVRVTPTSGSLNSGNANTWIAIGSSGGLFYVERSTEGGSNGCVCTVEIRRQGTSTVIDSNTITLTATKP